MLKPLILQGCIISQPIEHPMTNQQLRELAQFLPLALTKSHRKKCEKDIGYPSKLVGSRFGITQKLG